MLKTLVERSNAGFEDIDTEIPAEERVGVLAKNMTATLFAKGQINGARPIIVQGAQVDAVRRVRRS